MYVPGCEHPQHLTWRDVRLLMACGIEPWSCPRCEQVG